MATDAAASGGVFPLSVTATSGALHHEAAVSVTIETSSAATR